MSEPIRLGLRFDHGFAQAKAFLDALGGIRSDFTFQTFADRGKGDPPVRGDYRAQIITGTFEQHYKTLARLNNQRAGVFVTVNPQAGPGRSDANTARPRAIWHENDGAIPDNVEQLWPLAPSMVVRTRENHTHTYWLLEHTEGSADNWHLWEGIERHLVEHRGSDPNAMKRCQVLRVPDFFHVKDPANARLVQLAQYPNGKRYTLQQLAEAFPPTERQRSIVGPTTLELDTHGIQDLPSVTETDWRDILAALDYINPDAAARPTEDGGGTRGRWLRVLMALEETKHPDRRVVADEWSRCGGRLDSQFPVSPGLVQHAGYVEGEVEWQMQSFRRADGSKVGIGSLVRFAKEGGWPGWSHSLRTEDDPMRGLVAEGSDDSAGAVNASALFVHTRGDEALSLVPPAQDFLLDQFLAGDGTFSAIAGRGGVGKSKLVLGVAAAVASGTPAFGYAPLTPHIVGSTVIVDLENGRHEFTRRFQDHTRAMIQHNLLQPDEAQDVMQRVHHVFIDRMLYPLAFTSAGAPLRHNAHWNALYTELSRIRDTCAYGVRWCVLDALYKFHALNENDNMHMIYAMEQINDLVTRVFGHIPRSVVHHSRKGSTGDYWKDDSGGLRGAGAVEAAMRSVITLRHLSEDECRTMGVGAEQRRDFAIVQVAKSNYQVMKPDSFMVRAFNGTWWHCGREPVSIDEQKTAKADEQYQQFLVRLHEIIVIKQAQTSLYKLSEYYRSQFNLSTALIREFGTRAIMDGYVVEMGARRGGQWLKWAGSTFASPDGADELGF